MYAIKDRTNKYNGLFASDNLCYIRKKQLVQTYTLIILQVITQMLYAIILIFSIENFQFVA